MAPKIFYFSLFGLEEMVSHHLKLFLDFGFLGLEVKLVELGEGVFLLKLAHTVDDFLFLFFEGE